MYIVLLILPIYTCRPSVVYRGRLCTHSEVAQLASSNQVYMNLSLPLAGQRSDRKSNGLLSFGFRSCEGPCIPKNSG